MAERCDLVIFLLHLRFVFKFFFTVQNRLFGRANNARARLKSLCCIHTMRCVDRLALAAVARARKRVSARASRACAAPVNSTVS